MEYKKILVTGILFSGLFSILVAQTNWTWRNPLPQGNSLNSIIWTGSQLVAVGYLGCVLFSADAITWTAVNSGTSNTLKSVAWTGSLLVTCGDGFVIMTAPKDSSSGIDEVTINKHNNQLSLYPKERYLYVVLPDAWAGKKIQSAIYTVNGRKVQEVLFSYSNTKAVVSTSLSMQELFVRSHTQGETGGKAV
jgi:hypothetical protein